MIDREHLDDDGSVKWSFFELHVNLRQTFETWYLQYCEIVHRDLPHLVGISHDFMCELRDEHPSRTLFSALANGWITFFDRAGDCYIACETEDDAVLTRLLLGSEAR